MPSKFSPPPIAEQVILAVDAVLVGGQHVTVALVADFCDLPADQAESALLMATDLGFLGMDPVGGYSIASPLSRFVSSPDQMQRASALRVLLESYEPFLVFRQRLKVSGLVPDASRQTKTLLGLVDHQTDIGTVLISLGTYSQALFTEGGGRYEVKDEAAPNLLDLLMKSCGEMISAEERIRQQIGNDGVPKCSHDQVIIPLADALRCAIGRDSRGAIVHAGNAVETYLSDLGNRAGVNLAGSTGINAKIDELKRRDITKMPTKLANIGKYLGHVRNAADHGNDPEVQDSWVFRDTTGSEFVFVACSFISALAARELGQRPQI